MSWVCTNCQEEYADAPAEVCPACGEATVVPADAGKTDRPFGTARAALKGESSDSGLRNTSLIVGFAFWLVVFVALIFALVVGIALLF